MRRLIPVLSVCLWASTAQAITVTPGDTVANMITALTNPGTGLTITGLVINGLDQGSAASASWGTYVNPTGTYSIGPGILISSGQVAAYGDGPNTLTDSTTNFGNDATAAQAAILTGISGVSDYHDVTQIDITFDLDATHDSVFFNVVFGSDEFAEFVGSTFIDAFGLLINGTNVAFSGGFPINVDHPDFASIPGTELDGVLAPGGNPVLTFGQVLGFGATGQTLSFIIADRGDFVLDSTAYISALGGDPPPPTVPEPASVVLLATIAGALGYFKRDRFSSLAR